MNLLGLDTPPISSLSGRSKLDSYSFYSIILLCHLDVSKNSPKQHRNMVSNYKWYVHIYIYIYIYMYNIYLHDFKSICKYNMTPSSSRRPSAQATPHIPKQQAPRTRVHGPQAMQEKVRWIWNLKTNGWNRTVIFFLKQKHDFNHETRYHGTWNWWFQKKKKKGNLFFQGSIFRFYLLLFRGCNLFELGGPKNQTGKKDFPQRKISKVESLPSFKSLVISAVVFFCWWFLVAFFKMTRYHLGKRKFDIFVSSISSRGK